MASTEYSSIADADFEIKLASDADHLSNIHLIADTHLSRCKTPRWYINSKTGRREQSNCNRADCLNEDCRRSYARRHSCILQNEAELHPLDFYGTLRFNKGNQVTEKEWKIGIRKVSEALRKLKKKKRWKQRNKSIKFQYITDFTLGGTDCNLLIWTTGFRTWRTLKRHLRPIIQRYFPTKKFRIYIKPPESQIAVIKYSFKDLKDRSHVPMPNDEWLGKRKIGGCRMPSGRKKSDIWVEVRKQWFPEKKTHQESSKMALLTVSFDKEHHLPDPPPLTPNDSVGVV